MKKLVAVIMSLVMLLTACAFAEGSELVLNNIVLSLGDQGELDFSGIDLRLGVGENESFAGVNLAVDANGQNALNGVAALSGEQLVLILEGLSDIYAVDLASIMEQAGGEAVQDAFSNGFSAGFEAGTQVSEEDMAELEAALEAWLAELDASLTAVETETGESYTFAVSEEGNKALILAVMDVVDKTEAGAEFAAENGAESMRALWENLGAEIALEGMIDQYEGMIGLNANAILTAEGETATLNLMGSLAEIVDEASGVSGIEFTGMLSAIEGEESAELLTLAVSYTTELETGAFSNADVYVGIPDGNGSYEGLLLSVAEVEGQIQLMVSSLDGSTALQLVADETAAEVMLMAEGAVMGFSWLDGGDVDDVMLYVEAEGQLIQLTANAQVVETDAAWLPSAAVEGAVDLLTIDDAQMQKAGTELMSVLMNALSVVAGANETIAALLGGMMG